MPKTVTRQRRGCDLNPGPSEPESSTLTTRLPSGLGFPLSGPMSSCCTVIVRKSQKLRRVSQPRCLRVYDKRQSSVQCAVRMLYHQPCVLAVCDSISIQRCRHGARARFDATARPRWHCATQLVAVIYVRPTCGVVAVVFGRTAASVLATHLRRCLCAISARTTLAHVAVTSLATFAPLSGQYRRHVDPRVHTLAATHIVSCCGDVTARRMPSSVNVLNDQSIIGLLNS